MFYLFLFIYSYSHIFLLFYLHLLRINSAYGGGYSDDGGVVGVVGDRVVMARVFIYLSIYIAIYFTCLSSTAEDQ